MLWILSQLFPQLIDIWVTLGPRLFIILIRNLRFPTSTSPLKASATSGPFPKHYYLSQGHPLVSWDYLRNALSHCSKTAFILAAMCFLKIIFLPELTGFIIFISGSFKEILSSSVWNIFVLPPPLVPLLFAGNASRELENEQVPGVRGGRASGLCESIVGVTTIYAKHPAGCYVSPHCLNNRPW